jgi:CRISPR-associated endoribonuclease Cas6
VSGETTPTIRCFDLSFAVDGWAGGPAVRYEAAQGIVFGVLRHADHAAATTLHDANERKAIAVSPMTVWAVAPPLARADLRLAVWDAALAGFVEEALANAGAAALELGKRPAILMGWRPAGAWTVAELLATPPRPTVRVRFASPTFFGFGRHPNGVARAHRVPDPGPVVASWLRAWKLTGDRSLDWLPARPEAMAEAVALVELEGVRTVCVEEVTARLTGFVGECVYRWEGAEAEGRRALAVLARFAGICGTGAKTGRGFGRTEPIDPALAGGERR